MKLPFDRERMRERNLLDDIDDVEQMSDLTPGQRLRMCLEMSATARAFALAGAGQEVMERYDTVEEKALIWAAPLRASRFR